eukprot:CAMPEP_0171118740 /NCGR_PEP_ID=MMETSP0766_2-20121228/95464_1 /TAXON_ID=439317 /ORGANISM="Gambierdiscus australes, Strain CAWD 149" /LENGTH=133 /DNA_ID=CAMNT_0011581351 /DNA_START=39 /DNA_END=440 /DNA_ORIENTATION=+
MQLRTEQCMESLLPQSSQMPLKTLQQSPTRLTRRFLAVANCSSLSPAAASTRNISLTSSRSLKRSMPLTAAAMASSSLGSAWRAQSRVRGTTFSSETQLTREASAAVNSAVSWYLSARGTTSSAGAAASSSSV